MKLHASTKWRIKVNAAKSAAMIISKGQFRTNRDITLFGEIIPWEGSTKYLGVYMDRRLLWKEHVDYITQKAMSLRASLGPLLGRRSCLSPSNKMLLYKMCIRPVLTYAVPVWGYAARCHMHRLDTFQSTTLRRAVDVAWFVRNDVIRRSVDIEQMGAFIRRIVTDFYESLEGHPNELLNRAIRYDASVEQQYLRPRHMLTSRSRL